MSFNEQSKFIDQRLEGLAGDTARGVMHAFVEPFFYEDYWLPALVGGYGQAYNAPCVSLPSDIAEEQGGSPDQYGYIEFEIVDETERLDFDQAWKLFVRAADIYIEMHPDRRSPVEAKMREARKTVDHLIARHEAWKKANGVS